MKTWRQDWNAAAANPDEQNVASLKAQLEAAGLPEEEIEVEREMLDAVRELLRLQLSVEASGIPVLETGHRVVGHDVCHFSTPVSLPDDPAQPTGRLLFTNARVIFAGGARATTVPWHAVAEVVHTGRDVMLVRRDRDTLHRFRCNTYSDALCGAFLARRLAASRMKTVTPSRG